MSSLSAHRDVADWEADTLEREGTSKLSVMKAEKLSLQAQRTPRQERLTTLREGGGTGFYFITWCGERLANVARNHQRERMQRRQRQRIQQQRTMQSGGWPKPAERGPSEQ